MHNKSKKTNVTEKKYVAARKINQADKKKMLISICIFPYPECLDRVALDERHI